MAPGFHKRKRLLLFCGSLSVEATYFRLWIGANAERDKDTAQPEEFHFFQEADMPGDYVSFRDRERRYRSVGGSNARADMERRNGNKTKFFKGKKGPAMTPGVPCRVKDSQGNYYDQMPLSKKLFMNPTHPDGHTFPSRHKASRAVWHTIEALKAENVKWSVEEFVLENARQP